MKKTINFTGTVIDGTTLTEDLIGAFLGLLADYWPEKASELVGKYGLSEDWDQRIINEFVWEQDDDAEFLLDDLFDALNEIAPKGYYFGAHPGDGSDFGFWECEEEKICDTCRYFDEGCDYSMEMLSPARQYDVCESWQQKEEEV